MKKSGGGSFAKKPAAAPASQRKPKSGKPGLDGTEDFLHELDHCESLPFKGFCGTNLQCKKRIFFVLHSLFFFSSSLSSSLPFLFHFFSISFS